MELSCVLPTPSLLIGKDWVPVMYICECSTHCKVHWRVARSLGSYRLISAQPPIGSTITQFSISSVLWVLEVPCCQYRHNFHQIDHSMLLWALVVVNWLTSCQECVFWARYCSSCTPQGFFSILESKLIGYADDSTLIAVVPSPGARITEAEFLSSDLVKVGEWCDRWGMKFTASKTKTMIVFGHAQCIPSHPN